MNIIKKFVILVLFITLYSCAVTIEKKSDEEEKLYFTSKGFALIYDKKLFEEGLVNKKINNEKISSIHSFLKPGTPIQIINLSNSKSVNLNVSKKANYPAIFNIVISKKIAKLLELDSNNPYVEIIEVKKNKTFVSKKTTTFDEEKNVAEKAPVQEIEIDDLSENESNSESNKNKNIKKNFVLVLGDFYYEESALNLKNELISKIELKDISIKKVKQNQYRLFVGPFKNFNTLKVAYISLNKIGFDDLNIIRE